MRILTRKKNGIDDNGAAFEALVFVIVILAGILVTFPILHVVSMAVSDPMAVLQGDVWFIPVGFTLESFEWVLQESQLVTGFMNSLFYTVVGTTLSVALAIMAGYAFSIPNLPGGRVVMFLYTFTMLFSGGLIPTYLQIRDLNLIDTRTILIIHGLVAVYNVIIVRTYIKSNIPQEMREAAAIDGANDYHILFKIVIPLAVPVIAIIVLWEGVGKWNEYSTTLYYITNPDYYSLQYVVRGMLQDMSSSVDESLFETKGLDYMATLEGMKYAAIFISLIPVLIIFPFVQKYFVKGIMVGSLKG